MTQMTIDPSGIYEKAKAVARRAVIAPNENHSYGLADVMDQETWGAVLSSPLISVVPVHATLNGCVEGLRDRGVDEAQLKAGAVTPVSAVTDEDLQIARSWLSKSITEDLSEDDRQNLIDEDVVERGWVTNPGRLSSLVLALVLIGQAA